MKFKLEKGIPIPPKRGYLPKKNKSKYPFYKMEVGDSFIVPLNKTKAMRGAITSYRRSHPAWKYASRALPEGFRIWRTE